MDIPTCFAKAAAVSASSSSDLRLSKNAERGVSCVSIPCKTSVDSMASTIIFSSDVVPLKFIREISTGRNFLPESLTLRRPSWLPDSIFEP